MKKYKVTIYGCGSIGALKDDSIDSPGLTPRTHASAVYHHDCFELYSLIDSNYAIEKKANIKWNTSNEIDIPDVCVVATPEKTHCNIISGILDSGSPKAIICEKPFCSNYREAYETVDLCRKRNIPLFVNYTRRYSRDWQLIVKMARCEGITSCTIRYNRGLLRDGCHGLDIINWLFGIGYLDTINILSDKIIDYSENDPTRSYIFRKNNINEYALILAHDGRICSLFEVDIFTKKNRYTFTNHGTQLVSTAFEDEKVYSNGAYKSLSLEPIIENIDLEDALSNLYDNVYDVLKGVEKPLCIGEDALEVWKMIEKLK